MPLPPARRFSILDAMALVAATAVGLAQSRWVQTPGGFEPEFDNRLQIWEDWVWKGPPSCITIAWGFALLLIRLRAPRPRWRRLSRQPGFVASIMAIGSIPLGILLAAGSAMLQHPSSKPWISDLYGSGWYWGWIAGMIPESIGGAWLALAVCQRWDPEPTWIDRIGRGLGLFWLARWPVETFHPIIKYVFGNLFR